MDNNLPIPLLDLSHWRRGTAAERAALADQLDNALCRSGFLLLTGHGLSDLAEQIRAEVHRPRRRPDTPLRWVGADGCP